MSLSLRKRYDLCTCCPDAPRMSNFLKGEEGMHLDDQTYASNLHVHMSSYSRDCDGEHGHDWVDVPSERYTEDRDESDFWRDVVRHMVSTYTEGTLALTDGGKAATWDEPTDEGYRHVEARQCRDLYCAHETRHTVYDQYAELAGY